MHIKEIYPDLFESFSDRYQPTPENPTASADAFLSSARGLDSDSLRGFYTQESFFDTNTQQGSATIRFKIADGIFWERLIDKPTRFDRKANFIGSYNGYAWKLPKFDYTTAKEVWVTEGIFDAIALLENGVAAVSVMSCNNYPTKFLQELQLVNPDASIVVAFDGDKAGKQFTKKFIAKLEKDHWTANAAQPPFKVGSHTKLDWNELHQLSRLSEKDLAQYRYYGELLIAKTATAKAMVLLSDNYLDQYSDN